MVKKTDDTSDDSSPLDEVIVIISGYGPFPGVPDNNSTDVAGVIHDKLKDAGITTEQVIIDVELNRHARGWRHASCVEDELASMPTGINAWPGSSSFKRWTHSWRPAKRGPPD